MSEEKPFYFVADANFFIHGGAQVQTPPKIYMTSAAYNEVKDQRHKQILENFLLSHEIIQREPSAESVEEVTKTATDSGNIVLLSKVDIGLIALALDFMPEKTAESADEEETAEEDKKKEEKITTPGFDEWITPENYGKVEEPDEGVVLCTSDTTMQCVAQILGLPVISSTGQKVAEVKRWLLRCSSCCAETLDANREFCPECGGHSLIRYALVMRDGVERELPLPRRFEPTSKGKRFSLPKSRGGRHGKKDIITSEDMLNEARRKFKWSGGARKQPTAGADGHSFFEPRKMARAEPQYGTGKANPNAPNHLLGKKKKRNRPNH